MTNNKSVFIFDESLGHNLADKKLTFMRFEKWDEEPLFPMYYYYFDFKGLEYCIRVSLFKTDTPESVIITYHLPEQIKEYEIKSFGIHRLMTKKCVQFLSELERQTSYDIQLEVLPENLNKNITNAFLNFLLYRSHGVARKKAYQRIVKNSERLKKWCIKGNIKTVNVDTLVEQLKFTRHDAHECLRHSSDRVGKFLKYERNEKNEEFWHFINMTN